MKTFKQFYESNDTAWQSGGDHWGKVGDHEFDVSYVIQRAKDLPRVTINPNDIKHEINDQATVDKHAEVMKSGKWDWNREPLLAQKEWIDDTGKKQPVTVMDGNHRVAAANQAGLSEVVVVWVDDLLEEIKAEGNEKYVRPAGRFNYNTGKPR